MPGSMTDLPHYPNYVLRSAPELAAMGKPRLSSTLPLLLTAAEKASELGVSVDYVRRHREQLGVIRLGSGSRPRLMFRRGLPSGCLPSRESGTPSQPVSKAVRGGSEPPNGTGKTNWRPIPDDSGRSD